MKRVRNFFIAVIVLSCTVAMASQQPSIKPPSAEALSAVQLPKSAEVTVCAFSNTGNYTFAIFECKAGSRVCYLFRSEEINDFVVGPTGGMSRTEILKFFSVRFRGIANDISHQKWRSDVVDEVIGPLRPPDADSAKTYVLLALSYDGYASVMEEVRAAQGK